jgi:hypothetical protein
MTEPETGSPPPPTGRLGNEHTQRGPQCSQRDAIRRAHLINRTALEAVRGLLETPLASLECSDGWPGKLGVTFAEEYHSLELVDRCLTQHSAALEDPSLSGLADSVQALERTMLTLREVGRQKLMLAGLAPSGGSREDSMPIGALSDAVRREALSLVGKLAGQQAMLNRAIEARAALVQQVFSG